jgi:DNA-binding transcriptional LysR family regulator
LRVSFAQRLSSGFSDHGTPDVDICQKPLRWNLKALRSFVAVYRARSFSHAAPLLSTVQSNVSDHIHGLEDSLGVPLFIRGNRCLEPTRAADVLYEYAMKVTATLDEAESRIRSETAA